MKLRASFFALALSPLLALAGETEWPQFRGPTGQGISAATKVPIQWSATENIAWSVEMPGHGWSSPVLSKGRLYLTAAVPDAANDVTLRAFCLEAATGRQIWNVEVIHPDPAESAKMHRKNSPASPTPIVTADRLYVHFGHMGTAALDLTGKVLWTQTSLGYAPTHGNGGSPALVGDTLIFSADGAPDPGVVCLSAATGELKWKTPRNSTARKLFSFSTPLPVTVGGKNLIISPGSGFVGAYDVADGSELWRVNYGEGYSVVPRPIFAHGLLYLSSGFDAAWVYAIRPEGAAGDATESSVVWKASKGAPKTPSMVVVGDELYYVSDNGIASCANALTGEVYWAERLGGDFSASPVATEGRIYFQNETGVGYVVKAGKTFELLAKNEIGERSLASPAFADGTIYLRSEGHLWKIGK
ncbi:MAG TPA: PQQ-binding-like beta-propeller repeat protein [Chthoniobacteraceae bacterium]|jgi:outer membrane protein assembly factor BamB|nr:PQQ-binding-like beta-propeller repeat protein [Chthoniobacteraceae bacterium]